MTILDQPIIDFWQAYWVPKRGNEVEEYEDAFAGSGLTGRFAIADGASEASFASLWARILVDGFVKQVSPNELNSSWINDWLDGLRKRWADEIDPLVLPWYAEAKRAEGAFATLLGLNIQKRQKKNKGSWMAQAVGDSCLFQIRNEEIIQAFPLEDPEEFNNFPNLIGSRSSCLDHRRETGGKWKKGDRFFLMTDALAHWFLMEQAANNKPWQIIGNRVLSLDDKSAFSSFVEELRNQGSLRNDDVTLVIVAV